MQVQMLTAEPATAPAAATTAIPRSQPNVVPPRGPSKSSRMSCALRACADYGSAKRGPSFAKRAAAQPGSGPKKRFCDLLLTRRRHQLPEGARLELKEWESAIAGACAGVAYNIVLFPADSVKSALQTEEELRPRNGASSGGARRTFWGMGRAMYASQGVRGLYAGHGHHGRSRNSEQRDDFLDLRRTQQKVRLIAALRDLEVCKPFLLPAQCNSIYNRIYCTTPNAWTCYRPQYELIFHTLLTTRESLRRAVPASQAG